MPTPCARAAASSVGSFDAAGSSTKNMQPTELPARAQPGRSLMSARHERVSADARSARHAPQVTLELARAR